MESGHRFDAQTLHSFIQAMLRFWGMINAARYLPCRVMRVSYAAA